MKRDRKKSYQLGLRAELTARMLLRVKGYRILKSRYLTPYGEIDIIAERFGTLAFIEVKARPDATSALYSISPTKQRTIALAAQSFLGNAPEYAGHDKRFDLMLCCPFRLPHHLTNAWQL